ncbi:MAG: hypothetical protein ACQES9_05745 [Myxococcota bacterium]
MSTVSVFGFVVLLVFNTFSTEQEEEKGKTDRKENKKQETVEVKPVEGFQKDGFFKDQDTRKVKLLSDDRGKGEVVPRNKIEFSTGMAAAEDVKSTPGLNLNLGFFYMFARDYWAGISSGYSFAPAENDTLIQQLDFNGEFRRYFMAHNKANRFVMGHLLLQLGYSKLFSGGDNSLSSSGLNTGIGIGFTISLSVNWYLGLRFVYNFPIWGEVCQQDGAAPETCFAARENNFYLSWLKVKAILSYSF